MEIQNINEKIRLNSKKNQVYRIIEDGKRYIEKIFSDTERMENEVQILKVLKKQGCNVPEILGICENRLLLEDLGEVTLLDWYESKENEDSTDYTEMIEKLSKWMKCFYSITHNYYNKSIILFDVNFRNFLVKDDEIYGIDFEESQFGNLETDAGKLAAFSMTYNPAMSEWKLSFVEEMVKVLSWELELKRELVMEEREKELIRIKSRRTLLS